VFGGSSSFSIIESMQQVVVDIRIYLLYLLLMVRLTPMHMISPLSWFGTCTAVQVPLRHIQGTPAAAGSLNKPKSNQSRVHAGTD
jgi:hypothetical protein